MIDDRHGADVNRVTVVERRRGRHQRVPDSRAILAAEILERGVAIGDTDPRMTARNARRIEKDVGAGVPPEDVPALTAALLDVLRDPATLQHMRAAVPATLHPFTAPVVSARWNALFTALTEA